MLLIIGVLLVLGAILWVQQLPGIVASTIQSKTASPSNRPAFGKSAHGECNHQGPGAKKSRRLARAGFHRSA
ncbi:MAG: hypothetical protein EXS42_00060 [Lacunisphaera sp.]|nr:hypothetical protein [Lacunisphaera sp.]